MKTALFIICGLVASLSFANTNQTTLPLTFGSGFTKPNVSMAVNKNGYKYIDITLNKITKAKFMLPEATSLLYGLDIKLVEF